MKLIAIVPAYNEEKTVGSVITDVRKFVDEVIVIDDGSIDATGERAKAAGATVFRHTLNRGLGAALGTGMVAALRAGADLAITFDADGQHKGSDIPRLVKAIDHYDVAIGARTEGRDAMPLHRKVANWIGNVSTWLLFGIWTNDSQSGLRLMTRHAMECMHLWEFQFDNMEVSSAILAEIQRNQLRLVEVPIEPIYTEYSLSKGQSFTEGIRTILRLIWYRFMR
jgi:glycosyltransferase involved in cell wall biosynthesis